MVCGNVEAPVARKRQLVIRRLRRDSPLCVINVLMQGGHADLRVVDEIGCVLLHDAQTEIAVAYRQVASDLVVRVALRLEVERRRRALQR
jgi:hypothetical protein